MENTSSFMETACRWAGTFWDVIGVPADALVRLATPIPDPLYLTLGRVGFLMICLYALGLLLRSPKGLRRLIKGPEKLITEDEFRQVMDKKKDI